MLPHPQDGGRETVALLSSPEESPPQRRSDSLRRSITTGRLGAREFATVTLLLVDVISLVMVAAGQVGPLRVAVTLVAILAVPGWAVVAHLDLRWPAAEVALTLATSLAVLLVIGQSMISMRAWHPSAAWLAEGGLSAVLLVGRLARPRDGAGGS
jgi:hypothetical protein